MKPIDRAPQGCRKQGHGVRAGDPEDHGASETGRRALAETVGRPRRPAPQRGVGQTITEGLNVFMLSFAGFDSPWWFTPHQVNGLDGHIRKGERVSWVQLF